MATSWLVSDFVPDWVAYTKTTCFNNLAASTVSLEDHYADPPDQVGCWNSLPVVQSGQHACSLAALAFGRNIKTILVGHIIVASCVLAAWHTVGEVRLLGLYIELLFSWHLL